MTANDEAAPKPVAPRQMVNIGGVIYNPDHIVKVDPRRDAVAFVHTTLGTDEFTGEVAQQIKRFYEGPPPVDNSPAQGGSKRKGRP